LEFWRRWQCRDRFEESPPHRQEIRDQPLLQIHKALILGEVPGF
jgi:hypothetical protein